MASSRATASCAIVASGRVRIQLAWRAPVTPPALAGELCQGRRGQRRPKVERRGREDLIRLLQRGYCRVTSPERLIDAAFRITSMRYGAAVGMQRQRGIDVFGPDL